MKLSLLNTPNQELPFSYEEYDFDLILRTFNGTLYATVKLDEEVILASRRVVIGDNILGYNALSARYGSLVLMSRFGAKETDYESYNSNCWLEYTPADE